MTDDIDVLTNKKYKALKIRNISIEGERMLTLLLIVITMLISLMITPIVIAISKKLNIVDKPNFRKFILNQFRFLVAP